MTTDPPEGRVLSLLERLEARRRELQIQRVAEMLRRINGRMDAIRALGRLPAPWDDE